MANAGFLAQTLVGLALTLWHPDEFTFGFTMFSTFNTLFYSGPDFENENDYKYIFAGLSGLMTVKLLKLEF